MRNVPFNIPEQNRTNKSNAIYSFVFIVKDNIFLKPDEVTLGTWQKFFF